LIGNPASDPVGTISVALDIDPVDDIENEVNGQEFAEEEKGRAEFFKHGLTAEDTEKARRTQS